MQRKAGSACSFFFFSSRRRHTRYWRDWSSDVCSSDLFVDDLPLLVHHVVEYDDVMNKQRQIVYEERRKVLEGADRRSNILTYMHDVIEKGIDAHCESGHYENWDIEGLGRELTGYLPNEPGSQSPERCV